jgi:pilus assembly protein CpaF
VQVADQKVSGYHCNIFRRGLDLLLEDITSMNGTLHNGNKLVRATELSDQDTIRIGPMQFSLHISGAVAAESAEGSEALRAWVVFVASGVHSRHSLFTPTEPFIDLDAPQ